MIVLNLDINFVNGGLHCDIEFWVLLLEASGCGFGTSL